MSDFTEEQTRNLAGSRSSNKAEDPTGQFPTPEHYNRESTNTQARGENRNSLKWVASSEGVAQILTQEYISSIYPFNQVSRSITGHVYEVDDTPGNERVLIKHADGAGIELGVDGSVSISALGNKIEVAGGDQHITIVGDAKLVYQGNVDMQVTGEFNIDCNEFNVNVKNNKTEVIGGAESKQVYKGVTNSVVGNVANFVTEQVTDTVLGGHQYNVKGDVDYNIDGNVGFYSSGEMDVTSEDYINIASDNVTASANDMSILGGSGVIGGTAVDFVGNGAIFDRGITATVFTGDLKGTADVARSQTYGEAATADASSITADTPAITTPTPTLVNTLLTKSRAGIRKVKIDIGNYLKDFIDKANRYDGIATQTMTAKVARSKLRDPANRGNNKFVGSLLEEGTLCEQFNTPTPAAVGRIVDGQSTTIQAARFADAVSATNNVIFIPRNVVKQFLPDPLYNPLNLGTESITSITAKTKLSANISLSKFLGTEDPVNIKYIRNEDVKKNILKHLYPQVTILKQIQTNQEEFEGVTLEVTEGLYRPGNGEKITAGSINDLKSKGRAVVYKAVDVQGNINNSRLFDIAVWLKDNAYFDQLILSYDTNECVNGNPILSARLIITMPEIDNTFQGTFTREVYTEFNNNRLAQGELVECLPYAKNQRPDPNLFVPNTNEHDLDPKTKAQLRNLLIQAADEVGVRLVSGWQQVPARGLRPLGASGRHNTGYAHDVSLVVNGKVLQPFAFASDREIVKKFSKAFYDKARAAGYRPSIGWGSNYMDAIRGHYDIAAGIARKPSGQIVVQSRWGNYGKSVNAPDFLRDIYGY